MADFGIDPKSLSDVFNPNASQGEILVHDGTQYAGLTKGTTGQIIINNGTTLAHKTVSGDITIDSNGVVAIAAGVIVNADINASAAIAFSKMVALAINRALVSDGSGFIVVSAVTNTELGHLSGVTSAIQTQLDSKLVSPLTATLNANGNIIDNIGAWRDNSPFPSATGVQRMGNGGLLGWRNAANTNDITLSVNASDDFEFIFNGGIQYTLSDEQADFHLNNLVNAGISLTNNTLTGTSAELATAISDETGSGLLVFGTSPTIVTPTIASFVNATHSHLNAAGGGTITKAAISDTPWAKADIPATTVYTDQANVFGDFNQTFKDNRILIESPDGLTPITIVNLQQTLARNLTIPILTANDTIVTLGLAQTISATKTFSANQIFQDNIKVFFGTGSDASILYDGTNLKINPAEVGSGHLHVATKISINGDIVSPDILTVNIPTATLGGFGIRNADGSIELENAIASATRFKPKMTCVCGDSAFDFMQIATTIPTAQDSGTQAVLQLNMSQAPAADIVTRPLLSIANRVTKTWEMDKDGNVDMQGNDLSNVGDLEIDDAKNIILNTTTGTKFGTATGQKLAFYNSAPVAQQTGVAVTAAGIHAALVTLGLITA